MNSLTKFLSVNTLTPSKVIKYLHMVGIDVPVDPTTADIISDLIRGIQESGRYNTLDDILSDEDLIKSFAALNLHSKGQEESEVLDSVDIRTLVRCPHCQARFTLQSLRKD